MVHRVWKEAGLKPHRIERYLASDDADFESKAADIIGLYLNPARHAAVLCVDEKTAIQALDRLDPVLPLSPGRAERHGFEYFRHGTLSLCAALDTQSGKVLGKTAARHTSQEFVEFLTEVVERAPAREVYIILDNLSAHKSQVVRDFLATDPKRFVVAESSRDLVFQGRARRDCSRNLYQREGSGPQASPLYQRLRSER